MVSKRGRVLSFSKLMLTDLRETALMLFFIASGCSLLERHHKREVVIAIMEMFIYSLTEFSI